MTLQSLRNTWIAAVLSLITAGLLASCGGGGAAPTTTGGVLQVSVPNSMYGGVPATITIAGGRSPYTITTSEPGVLPVPSKVSGSTFTVLPANPGVVDVGLPAGALPVRTVNITVIDANGSSVSGTTKVGVNFLTGYGMSFGVTTCTAVAGGATAAAAPCSGGDTEITFQAVFNGNLYGDREFKLDVLQGPVTLINPTTGASGTSIGVTSDHTGVISAIVRGAPNQVTQLVTLRLSDPSTGVQTFDTFVLNGGSTAATLVTIPSTFTFTGPDSSTCGTGSGQFFVFDGTPPYTAIASDPNIILNFVDPNHNPGRFQFTVANSGVCLTNGAIIVTDAAGARTTVTVTTAPGATAPVVPPTPVQVQPTSITLGCAQSGSVLAIGGGTSGGGGGGGGGSTVSYSAASSSPLVTATVSGNTITITRAGPAGPGSVATMSSTVNVTDGSTIATVTVTSPQTCP